MTQSDIEALVVAVVIPCYREKAHIVDVIERIPVIVSQIYCVDDACPDHTGDYVKALCDDSRISHIQHQTNQGVGGAVISGYRAALEAGADIVIKLDGDGQMNPELIPSFVAPIIKGQADYTKGNRFYRLEGIASMPFVRLFGNAILSFMNKLSTGYWQLFDPNNGFTAIHANVLRILPLNQISRRYFFESDMLFRLNILRAVVIDIPMRAKYGAEASTLSVKHSVVEFSYRHSINFSKRIFYNYYLRDFHLASIEWLLGPVLFIFGIIFGFTKWIENVSMLTSATAGTVMLAALPVIIGLQLLLSALSFDIDNKPTIPVYPLLNVPPEFDHNRED